jgi:uncharacterized flavoprotein (TIGR03862 family)
MKPTNSIPNIAVIGGGPAGLMAAQTLAEGQAQVDVYDAMPSVGRKFLLAGKKGLILTHAEDMADFPRRYGRRQNEISHWVNEFNSVNLRQWVKSLGVETFVNASGHVFPNDMKAAPLLRAWVRRLRAKGVRFHMRHRWIGWQNNELSFIASGGEVVKQADAMVLALGGASWPECGSDGAWVSILQSKGIQVASLESANCGFNVNWSEHFKANFAGESLNHVAIIFTNESGALSRRLGQCIITKQGIEGNLIYALSSLLRDQIKAHGSIQISLDLLPDLPLHRAVQYCEYARASRSISEYLQSRLNLDDAKASLLKEVCTQESLQDATLLAHTIKSLPITLVSPYSIDTVISTAGGVKLETMHRNLMFKEYPGVFCAGEMLDWEAPASGYLLTACLASGKVAGKAALNWVANSSFT